MHKKSITVMLVISLIVLVLGLICGVGVYFELSSLISKSGTDIYIDGKNFSGIIGLAGQAGTFVLSALIVLASFFAVGVQWMVYLIVKLIKNYIDKKNQSQMYIHDNKYI